MNKKWKFISAISFILIAFIVTLATVDDVSHDFYYIGLMIRSMTTIVVCSLLYLIFVIWKMKPTNTATNKRIQRVYNGFFKIDRVETEQGVREVVRATNSASVLLHDRARRKILLIRQPHASLECDENPHGLIIESVAGRFDCNLKARELIVKEALEEAGVTLEEDKIIFLNNGKPMAVSAGMTGELSYLGYAEITPDMVEKGNRIFGCPEEGEQIERVWMNVEDFLAYPCGCTRLFAYQQWLKNKLQKEKEI